MTDEQPKIIIDEDWKSQVQREREQSAQPAQANEDEQPYEGG